MEKFNSPIEKLAYLEEYKQQLGVLRCEVVCDEFKRHINASPARIAVEDRYIKTQKGRENKWD